MSGGVTSGGRVVAQGFVVGRAWLPARLSFASKATRRIAYSVSHDSLSIPSGLLETPPSPAARRCERRRPYVR